MDSGTNDKLNNHSMLSLIMFPQVLATVGGSGTRLYPLTLDQPKPLVELCDTAIIATLFRVLASQGCRRFILGSKGASTTLNLSNYFRAGDGFFKRLGITTTRTSAINRYMMTRVAQTLFAIAWTTSTSTMTCW